MPVTTRAATTKTKHELLWEVLRTGPSLRLDERDLVNCMLACKALRSLAFRHVVDLIYDSSDVQTKEWWRPEALCGVEVAYLHPSTLQQLPALQQLRKLVFTGSEAAAGAPLLDLTPLSSLRQLETLVVDAPATGVHALPPVSALRFNPGNAQALHALRCSRSSPACPSSMAWLVLAA